MKKKILLVARLAAPLAFGLSALLATPAEAAAVQWHSAVVHVTTEGRDVKTCCAISRGTRYTCNHFRRRARHRERQLRHAAAAFSRHTGVKLRLRVFWDGKVLSISDMNTVTRRVIKLDHASVADLRATLTQLGIENSRFPINYDESQSTGLVSGPQAYVQLVSEIARRLDDRAAQSSGSMIRVFPLRHAWAGQHNVQIDGKTVTVSGVADLLSAMYHQRERNGADSYRTANDPTMRRLQPTPDVTGSTDGGSHESGVNPPLPGGNAASGGVSRASEGC